MFSIVCQLLERQQRRKHSFKEHSQLEGGPRQITKVIRASHREAWILSIQEGHPIQMGRVGKAHMYLPR